MVGIRVANIYKRLDKIKDKILDEKFIKGRGLGNEISFYIFDYDPKYELIVRDHVKFLKKMFSHERYNRQIIEFDLYKMLLELTKEKQIYEQIFQMERDLGGDKLLEALINFSVPDIFIEKIKQESEEYNVIFITGVGKVYPFVRSHTILNNLQEKIDKKPVIMFYPGEYSGQSLNLFNTFMDDNYYRAFQLIEN